MPYVKELWQRENSRLVKQKSPLVILWNCHIYWQPMGTGRVASACCLYAQDKRTFSTTWQVSVTDKYSSNTTILQTGILRKIENFFRYLLQSFKYRTSYTWFNLLLITFKTIFLYFGIFLFRVSVLVSILRRFSSVLQTDVTVAPEIPRPKFSYDTPSSSSSTITPWFSTEGQYSEVLTTSLH